MNWIGTLHSMDWFDFRFVDQPDARVARQVGPMIVSTFRAYYKIAG
jgi:hypothetical protein